MHPLAKPTPLTSTEPDDLELSKQWEEGLSHFLMHHSEDDLQALWYTHVDAVTLRREKGLEEASTRKLIARRAVAAAVRRKARRLFLRHLSKFTAPSLLLSELLAVGRLVGVTTIRYYSHQPGDGLVESVDSAGQTPMEADMLQMGAVRRTRPDCPSDRSDAFVCIDARVPVLFTIDSSLDRPLVIAPHNPADGRIRRARQREWQTSDVLPQAGDHRIEVPLVQAGEVIGKLSCGFDNRHKPPRAALLDWFAKVAEKSATALHALRPCEPVYVRSRLDKIRDEVNTLRTVNAFFDYCADEMPELLGASHASILTLSQDATSTQRLILRRTSYKHSQVLEKGGEDSTGRVGVYHLDDPFATITGWATVHKRTARLQQLRPGDPFFLAQLRRLHPDLRWSNVIQDSSSHDSLLVVPLVYCGQSLGVVRFTEKAGGGQERYFTPADEHHLTRLADDILAPRLHALLDHEADGRFCEFVRDKQMSVAVAEAFDGAGVKGEERGRRIRAFKDVMSRVVGNTGGRHLFLANRVRDGDKERITSLPAGSLNCTPRRPRLDAPLVELALKKQQCVYLHDLDTAEQLKMYRPVCAQARSAIACPIRLGPTEQWVLIMLSDRWDFYPEVAAKLLTRVTEHSAQFRR
jgi:hypothetical protein